MKFYKPSEMLVLQFHFGLGLFALILFAMIIPESPKWLFMKKGTNCRDAINILNYIAWFNGSPLRVPEDAVFDVIGQVLEEDNPNLTKQRLQMSTIIDISHAIGDERSVKSAGSKKERVNWSKILKEFKQLYFIKKNSKMHWKLKLLFIMVFNIYFLAIFNAS